MKLFATLNLDEDVSALTAMLLRARGLDVTTARDEGLLGQDDPVQLAHAVSLERCILTHNRVHFERLHEESLAEGRRHWGIIVASRRSPYEIARRLAILLNTLTAEEIAGQILYV